MLVSENSRRSKVHVLYGILAKSALEQFDAEESALDPERSAYFQNLIRLLEMYRYESLQRPTPRAVLDRHQHQRLDSGRELQEATLVEAALKKAHTSVYPDYDKQELLEHLKGLFSRVLSRESNNAPSILEVRQAKKFLREFAAGLRS